MILFLQQLLHLFFLQAEDGIRDLVRSRGLGDVYKRQEHDRSSAERHFAVAMVLGVAYSASIGGLGTPIGRPTHADAGGGIEWDARGHIGCLPGVGGGISPVSFTHISLPRDAIEDISGGTLSI